MLYSINFSQFILIFPETKCVLLSQNIFHHVYIVGNFGVVYLGTLSYPASTTTTYVAVKTVKGNSYRFP